MSLRKVAALTAASVLVIGTGLTSAGSSSAAAPGADVAPNSAAVAAGPDLTWDIRKGAVFNDPRDGRAWRINNKIRRTIQNTPGGEKIRIMTWNLAWDGVVKDLIKAHKRGVSVRLIMSRGMAKEQGYHGSYRTLRRGLNDGANKDRPWWKRSWARTCKGSCRGRGGAMHSKFIAVTKSGVREKVVSQGSANFTVSAATVQWNDWYTVYENDRIWRAYKKVFKQAKKDKPQRGIQRSDGTTTAFFDPHLNQDKVLKVLNKVKCRGARGAGINGKTSIRIAAAVFENERGMQIAKKLRALHRDRCNIRIVYTMMPYRIREVLSSLPVRHLAYDWDGDGSYDRYLHMKAMAISGHWNGDRGHRLVLNGSGNWDALSLRSDEQGMVIHKPWQEKKYGERINELFDAALEGGTMRMRQQGGDVYEDNPEAYQELELELAGQG